MTAVWDPRHLPSQTGKTFVVTGGNAGIGYFTGEQLAARGRPGDHRGAQPRQGGRRDGLDPEPGAARRGRVRAPRPDLAGIDPRRRGGDRRPRPDRRPRQQRGPGDRAARAGGSRPTGSSCSSAATRSGTSPSPRSSSRRSRRAAASSGSAACRPGWCGSIPSDLLSERRYRPFRAYAFSKHCRARLRVRARSSAARRGRLPAVDARASRIRRHRPRRTAARASPTRRAGGGSPRSCCSRSSARARTTAPGARCAPPSTRMPRAAPSSARPGWPLTGIPAAPRAGDVERVARVRRAPLGARGGEDRRARFRRSSHAASAASSPVRHPWAMRVLVVGATGILRPAVAALAARGDDVTGVSRGVAGHPGWRARPRRGRPRPRGPRRDPRRAALGPGDRLPQRRALGVAARDRAARRGQAGAGPHERCGRPGTRASRSPGRTCSSSAGPTTARAAPAGTRARRSPRAALEVFDDGEYRMLGVVRPWRDRPVV